MKRFQFSLNTVLSYKQQVLEELQNEHGQLLYQVRQQELVLQAAEERYRGLNLEFRQAETEGLTIAEALRYESGLRFLEDEIQREAKRLREYEAAAEEKRRQVVAARQDTASLEKLKDKKWEDYQKQVQKGEELLIEELVTAARTAARPQPTGTGTAAPEYRGLPAAASAGLAGRRSGVTEKGVARNEQ